ncbi:uncharacterized protein LOC119326651 isoform X3 [Triticum dicoccoides]|uniref:uncharacterized protein LOC119326651 isoform X3 n=1 Tax=Triticum dicoccoides TaxID=85692 RepID=UPI001890D8E6|nr:uncharacterized protein LOC119326651 isoform X3 [Triticum dicoccoides]
MSSEEAEMLPPAAVAALPLDDDNLLSEILLRLPPLPSSLPRASAVCRRWRSLASDPAFSRRFRLHHRRNPPLLGCFYGDYHQIHFEPTLEPPNRVPPRRLSLQADVGDRFWPLGSRHGLVLIFNETRLQFLVWDPVTGHQHCIAIPREFDRIKAGISGAVLRSAARDIHFKVVLAVANDDNTVLASVYSSETRVWGNLITSIPFWKFFRPKMPVDRINVPCYTPMRADDGELGLLSLTFTTAQLWKRKIDCDGTAPWGVARTIELDKLLSLDSGEPTWIQGFAEDKNLVSLCAGNSNFTVQLESLEFKKPSNPRMDRYFPFESVYAAGI